MSQVGYNPVLFLNALQNVYDLVENNVVDTCLVEEKGDALQRVVYDSRRASRVLKMQVSQGWVQRKSYMYICWWGCWCHALSTIIHQIRHQIMPRSRCPSDNTALQWLSRCHINWSFWLAKYNCFVEGGGGGGVGGGHNIELISWQIDLVRVGLMASWSHGWFGGNWSCKNSSHDQVCGSLIFNACLTKYFVNIFNLAIPINVILTHSRVWLCFQMWPRV